MGKLINKELDYINECIDTREKLDYTQYCRFLDNAPITITYYNQSRVESTVDEGFHNTNEFAGDDSSIRYNKIENVPLYAVGASQIEMNEDETGLKPGFASEGILLPNMFMPIANDFFVISYMDRHILFKVTDVNPGTIKSNEYFKISFKFNKIEADDELDIEEQVSSEYVTIFDNIGTEDKVVIEKEVYIQIEKYKTIIHTMKNRYIETFFYNKLNSFLCHYKFNNEDKLVYNKYLTNFCIKNKLFFEKNQYETIYLEIEVSKGRMFEKEYNDSLFKSIEESSVELIKTHKNFMFPKFINEKTNVFFNRQEPIHDILLMQDKEADFYTPALNEELIEKLISTDDQFIYNNIKDSYLLIIKKYLNKSKIEEEDIERLDNFPLEYDGDLFILTPIVIYLLKKIVNNLLIKYI